MNERTLKLMDQDRNVVAVARVVEEGGRYEGAVDLTRTPVGLRALFEEYEEIVNGQMFSFLDEIEDKITALPLKAALDNNGAEASVRELQVYPSTGEISFKLAEVPASSAKPA
jgi:hypothetical protein